MLPPGFDRPGESRIADNICVSWRPSCLWRGTFAVSHTAKVSPLTQPYLSNVQPSSLPCYKKGTPTTTLNFCPPPAEWAGGGLVPRLRTGKNLCHGADCLTISGFVGTPQLATGASTAKGAKDIGLRCHQGERARAVVAQRIGK